MKDHSEVQSLGEAGDIKCERQKEETSSELIDTDVSMSDVIVSMGTIGHSMGVCVYIVLRTFDI